MKIRSLAYILALVFVFGCKELGLSSSYRDLGSFSSRVEAQNKALADIYDKYGSLSTSRDYKVKYANANALPSESRQNALWYNKSQEKLYLEVDIPDGYSCSWEKVTKEVLEQAIKSKDGMLKVDSLAKSNQPINTCLR